MTSADEIYDPFTALQWDNRPVKHMPWSAFKMVGDWKRVIAACDILGVSQVVLILLQGIIQSIRIQSAFNNTSSLRRSQPAGVHYLPLRSFNGM